MRRLADNYTPKQKKVSDIIRTDLAGTKDIVGYLRGLDIKLNDSKSDYYLDNVVHSTISTNNYQTESYDQTVSTKHLKRLFEEGKTLPNLYVEHLPFIKGTGKPFDNIICNNLKQVIAQQDFNGEPYLTGMFKYKVVLLPQERLPLNEFYPVLTAILNGYYLCEGGNEDSLKALANNLYLDFAPSKHQTIKSEYYKDSFQAIENIVKGVMGNPKPIKGNTRIQKNIWNPDYQFTPEEKSAIFNELNGNKRKSSTFEKLQSTFTQGMTQKVLVDKTGLSLTTVKMYWKYLKDGQLEHPQKGFPEVA